MKIPNQCVLGQVVAPSNKVSPSARIVRVRVFFSVCSVLYRYVLCFSGVCSASVLVSVLEFLSVTGNDLRRAK